MREEREERKERWESSARASRSVERLSWIAGVIGLALAGVGAVLSAQGFLEAYLFGMLFWLWIALGCLALLMLHSLLGASWTACVRAPLEAAARTIPFLGIGFLPLFVGVRLLYPWAAPGATMDASIAHKASYLNIPFFILRAAIYFIVWSLLFFAYRSRMRLRGEDTPADRRARLRALGAGALVAYVVTVTLASIDWIMSLDPHWFSTIFGALAVGGQGLSAFAFILVLALLFKHSAPARLEKRDRHDLGNMMLAFVLLWSYFAFSQYLIIYSGNLSEEIPWYLHRSEGAWRIMATALILFHFALPFMVLLFRRVKRSRTLLGVVAGFLLVMRAVELLWLTAPSYAPVAPGTSWMYITTFVGIGGIWLALFLRMGGARAEPHTALEVPA